MCVVKQEKKFLFRVVGGGFMNLVLSDELCSNHLGVSNPIRQTCTAYSSNGHMESFSPNSHVSSVCRMYKYRTTRM